MTLKIKNLKNNDLLIKTISYNFYNKIMLKKKKKTFNLSRLLVLENVIDFSKEFKLSFVTIFGLSIKKCEQFRKLFGINLIKFWFLKDIVFQNFNLFNAYIPLINVCEAKLISLLIMNEKSI